jgi:hypothetical protein
MTSEQLEGVIAECERRFHAKADQIHLENPTLPRSICFSRAIAALPRTAEKFQQAKRLLAGRQGILPPM